MGDIYLSTTKATYYPPALLPGFMGQFIPIKHGYGSLYEGAHVNYFQNHRNETLPVSSSEWGLQSTPYSPRPDLVAVDKVVNIQRMLQKPQMPLSLVVTDPDRRREVDNFYMAAQMHRDQYKDHSGRLHPLDYFRNAEYRWQCSPELIKTYMKCPQYYVKYHTPPVLPITLARTSSCPPLPERSLAGRYYNHGDSCYKR